MKYLIYSQSLDGYDYFNKNGSGVSGISMTVKEKKRK